jgi:hypothetical protein
MLPLLFKNDERNPLFPHIQNSPYSKIAVSIANPVCGEKKFVGGVGDDLPRDLPAICRRAAGVEFSMQNDSVCWTRGAIAFLKSKGQNVTFPSLAITFGTNPGAALCQDENTITDIEPYYILDQHSFTRLITCALWQGYFGLFPGKAYFTWKFHDKPFQDEEMRPYLDGFNQLIQAFSEDLIEYIEKEFGSAPASLMIGGGNSRFVRVPNHPNLETHLLNLDHMEREHVSPDVIQLLGAKLLMETRVTPDTIPSYEEIIKKQQAAREGRYATPFSIITQYSAVMSQKGLSFLWKFIW